MMMGTVGDVLKDINRPQKAKSLIFGMVRYFKKVVCRSYMYKTDKRNPENFKTAEQEKLRPACSMPDKVKPSDKFDFN